MPAQDDILAALNIGVLTMLPDGRIRYANPAAHRLLGLAPQQLLDPDCAPSSWDVVGPQGEPLGRGALPMVRAAAERVPVCGVVVGVRRVGGGRCRWLRVDAIPSLREDGTVATITCSMVDLSAQQLLHRGIFNALTEGVVVHDGGGGIVDANPAAEAVLGLSLEQLQGRTALDPLWRLEEVNGAAIDPETVPFRISQRDGVPVRGRRLAVHRPDGGRAVLAVNSEPVFAPGDDAPAMVVATFSDITVQATAQGALQKAGDRFERISDTVPGVVLEWRWSPTDQLHLEFAGGAGRHAIQLGSGQAATIDALLGQVHAADRDALRSALAEARRSLAPIDLRARLLPASVGGAERWFHIRGTPTRVDGELRLYMLLLDVDRQVRLAESMRENLRRQTIGELAAGIAHNFNNMLAVILPNIEDAVSRVPLALRPQLEDAVEATQSAAELVRQMLQLARRDTVDDYGPVELVAVLSGALRIARRTFHPRIQLDFAPPATPCWLRGSAGDLQQLLLNLLLNARDALHRTPHPHILLQLSASAGGDRWKLAVHDNGGGMDAGTLARLGEPFFTTKGPTQGAGMGVATAMSIARDHGGTLRYASTPGEGTTVTLLLPQLQQPPAPEPEPQPAPRPKPRRVLLVDDEPLVRRVLTRTLARRGIVASEACDGPEGIALLEAEPDGFSAVLLDLSMPGMPGAEVFQCLRALSPRLPIIVITGDTARSGALEGALAVVQKPLQSARLFALLEQAFAEGGPD